MKTDQKSMIRKRIRGRMKGLAALLIVATLLVVMGSAVADASDNYFLIMGVSGYDSLLCHGVESIEGRKAHDYFSWNSNNGYVMWGENTNVVLAPNSPLIEDGTIRYENCSGVEIEVTADTTFYFGATSGGKIEVKLDGESKGYNSDTGSTNRKSFTIPAGKYSVQHTGKGEKPSRWIVDIKSLISSISLSETSLTYTVEDAAQTLTVDPATAEVTWSSDNKDVATVDNGKVTPVGPGTATITAALVSDPTVTASCAVTVKKAPNPVVIEGTAEVTVGGNTLDLSSHVPDEVGSVTYALTEACGCTLQGSVLKSGTSTGTCVVTVTIAGDDKYESATGTITVKVTEKDTQELSFDQVHINKTYGDAAFINPLSGAKTKVTYAVTEGTDCASVAQDGKVTIKAAGTATITATAEETATIAGDSTHYVLKVNKAPNPVVIEGTAEVTVGGNTLDLSSHIPDEVGKVTYTLAQACDCTLEGSVLKSGTSTGTCIVAVKIAGDDNYEGATGIITINVTEKETQELSFDDAHITKAYGDAAFINPLSGAKTKVTYAVTEGTDCASVAQDGTVTIKAAGTATITATAEETATVAGDSTHYILTVHSAESGHATVTTVPTAISDLVYTGFPQALITSGEADGGTMQYAIGTDATTAPTSGWSTAIPTGADAGTYYVWYKAVGDIKHSESEAVCVTVKIGPKAWDADFVDRCYQYILGREPDAAGKAYWVDQLESEQLTAEEVLLYFFDCPEYHNSKRSFTNEEFVEVLYKVMLNRSSDAEGKTYWLGLLNAGSTRTQIISGFCWSVEFGGLCKTDKIRPNSGIEGQTEAARPAADMRKIRAFVGRCYQFLLGREADEDGLEYWADKLGFGGLTAVKAIENFVTSEEFLNRKLSNGDIVEVLYQVMLNRASDAEGKAYWVAVLDAGKPIAAVINGIAGSPEFKAICQEYGMVAGTLEVTELPAEMIPEGEITVNKAPATKEVPAAAAEPAPADERTEQARAFVTHCYQSALLRDPGAEETDYYANQILSGQMTARDIMRAFAFSQEFQGKWTDSTAYVRVLYRLCLDREADADGLVYWTDKLANGETAAAVFNALTENKEFVQVCAKYGVPAGVDANAIRAQEEAAAAAEAEESPAPAAPASEFTNEEKIRAFVSRFYRDAMGRDADEEGLNYYTGRILNGEATPKDVARDIILSEEFRGRMPGNEELVRILYRVYLGREADEEGLKNWAGQLDSGVSLENILNGFAGSEEFAAVVNGLK